MKNHSNFHKIQNQRNPHIKPFACKRESFLWVPNNQKWEKEALAYLLEALTMEKNIKEKKSLAEILWERYQCGAWEVGKGFMHSKLHLGQGKSNMQEEREWLEEKRKNWFSQGLRRLNEMKEKKNTHTHTWGLVLVKWVVILWEPKTPPCGSRMRLTKERKMIIEISSFQKV